MNMTIPQHIAIIMDGNGRWSKQRLLPKIAGHQKGAEVAKAICLHASKLGIKYLTLYTFSSENWGRPQKEVDGIMELLQYYVSKEAKFLNDHNIRLKIIGNLEKLSNSVRQKIDSLVASTEHNTGMTVIMALSYGAREEITRAASAVAKDYKSGLIAESEIDEDLFANYLYTKDMPYPDLLIRTGGDLRISNFLLWQLSYAELYFTKTYWPDFTTRQFDDAILEFQQRERRYGK